MFGKPSSKAVLLSFLDDEQKKCLETHGHFFVLAPNGDVYGITPRGVAQMKDSRVHRYRNVWPVGHDDNRLDEYEALLHLSLVARTDPDWLWRFGCSDPPGPNINSSGCPPMKRTKLKRKSWLTRDSEGTRAHA